MVNVEEDSFIMDEDSLIELTPIHKEKGYIEDLKKEKGSINEQEWGPLKTIIIVSLVCQTVAAVIFTQWSRSTLAGSDVRFAPSTAVVCAEFLKTIIGIIYVLLYGDIRQVKDQLWKLSVPALCYLIQNNLLFIALTNLDACVFQVIYQIKTFTTAVFSVVLLKRDLSKREWIAIFFLMCGAALANYGSEKPSQENDKLVDRNTTLGIIVVLCSTLTSGFAGVWVEKILKGVKVDLWVRNIQLGMFSIIGGLVLVWQNDSEFVKEYGFFGGYTWSTWIVIILNTIGGYLVALTIKYTSNIIKAFANGAAIIFGSILSVILFGFTLTFAFAIAVCFVILGIYMNSDQTLLHLRNLVIGEVVVLMVIWAVQNLSTESNGMSPN